MSTDVPGRQEDPYRPTPTRTGGYGIIAFASIMLCVLGVFHAVMGLMAIFQEDYFLVGEAGLMVEVDYTAWGWTHLLLGIIVACAGVALTMGATWARIVAVAVAVMSMLTNLAFMSAYPLWSIIMIAVNILVIYAVTVHGDPKSLKGD